MRHRSIALLVLGSLALSAGGCELFNSSPKSKGYDEVLMPKQTGSTLQRRAVVDRGPENEATPKPKKKKPAPPKPEPESSAKPTATPKPEEESTPEPERFR